MHGKLPAPHVSVYALLPFPLFPSLSFEGYQPSNVLVMEQQPPPPPPTTPAQDNNDVAFNTFIGVVVSVCGNVGFALLAANRRHSNMSSPALRS